MTVSFCATCLRLSSTACKPADDSDPCCRKEHREQDHAVLAAAAAARLWTNIPKHVALVRLFRTIGRKHVHNRVAHVSDVTFKTPAFFLAPHPSLCVFG